MKRLLVALMVVSVLSIFALPAHAGFYLDHRPHRVKRATDIVDGQSVEVPVFFATDRKKREWWGTGFGNSPSNELYFGQATVRVPLRESMLKDGDLKPELKALGVSKVEKSSKAPLLLWTGYPFNNYVGDPTVLSRAEFWKAFDTTFGKQPTSLYIHGYAAEFRNAIYTTALFELSTLRPAIVYSWPSRGSMTVSAYDDDERTVDDRKETATNAEMIFDDLCLHQAAAAATVSVISHSLGSHLALDLLNHANPSQAQTMTMMTFLAPDQNVKLFADAITRAAQKPKSINVLMCPFDSALAASERLHTDRTGVRDFRIGKHNINLAGVRFIDYGLVAEPPPVYHYIDFDIFANILNGLPPTPETNLVSREVIEQQLTVPPGTPQASLPEHN